jgi:hypothetical protein
MHYVKIIGLVLLGVAILEVAIFALANKFHWKSIVDDDPYEGYSTDAEDDVEEDMFIC